MPVLDIGRDLYKTSCFQCLDRFSFFLIPAMSGKAEQDLSAALACVMDMPVIDAAWFEDDIPDAHIFF